MNTKPVLLAWCDSPTVSTGFGRVARELLCEAHKDFDVHILGINYVGQTRYDHNLWSIYELGGREFPGFDKLIRSIKMLKPKVIFLFQDIFHISAILSEVKRIAGDAKIVLYYPIDSSPPSEAWKNVFQDTNVKHVLYSEFAQTTISNLCPEFPQQHILYHGVDTSVFKPIAEEDVDIFRRYKEWDNKFVMVNINRFQTRKNIAASLRVGALLKHGYKKCKCGNYYSKDKNVCDLNNCGPDDVMEIVEPKLDILLYLHTPVTPGGLAPEHIKRSDLLFALALNCGWVDSDVDPDKSLEMMPKNFLPSLNPLTDDDLCMVYNAANVNVTTTLGEGFGLNLVEASACGTTTVAPNNTVIREILGETGRLVPNNGFVSIAGDSSNTRPLVSVPGLIDEIEVLYSLWVQDSKTKTLNLDAIDNVNKRFLWPDKREALMKIFKE